MCHVCLNYSSYATCGTDRQVTSSSAIPLVLRDFGVINVTLSHNGPLSDPSQKYTVLLHSGLLGAFF